MGTPDWRTQLPSGFCENGVNRIVETLKDRFPFSGQPIEEVKRFGTQFEKSIFDIAANQEEYIRLTTLNSLTASQNEDAPSSASNIPPLDLGNSNPSLMNKEPATNWRAQLPRDVRLRNIETIVDNMRSKPDPNSRRPDTHELMTIAIRWEESSFYTAINKVSLSSFIHQQTLQWF